MTRLQGILAAGSLTGIVAATAVAISVKDFALASTPTPAPVAVPMVEPQVLPAVDPAVLAQYQAQMEQANQTILQLQAERDRLAQQAAVPTSRDEEHEFEHEEGDDD